MIIEYKKLNPAAHDPFKKYDADLCWDLASCGDHTIETYAVVGTGLQINIPEGHYGAIMSRSGLAADFGVFVLNAPGIVDAGYSGEIKIVLGNIEPHTTVKIHDGERIAQVAILPFEPTYMSRNDSLTIYSMRGASGFASTGY